MSRENVRDWVEKVLLADDVTDLGDLSFLDPEIVYEDEILPNHVGETYRGARAVAGHGGERSSPGRASRDGWSGYAKPARWSCPVTTKSFLDPAEALEAAGLRE